MQKLISSDTKQWLTLKDASDFLGIHFTTLRAWADAGTIAVFRTPGGHRRFSVADLRRFLEERGIEPRTLEQNISVVAEQATEQAIVRVRQEVQKQQTTGVGWAYPLASDSGDSRRQRGRQLFALAISYILKPAQRVQLLQDGRQLGTIYGQEAYQQGVSLVDTGRAVQFFRKQLVEAIQNPELQQHNQPNPMDADDVQIQTWINQFLDEILYAVLEGFEQAKAVG